MHELHLNAMSPLRQADRADGVCDAGRALRNHQGYRTCTNPLSYYRAGIAGIPGAVSEGLGGPAADGTYPRQ
ncbi:hypothetical protein [Rhizobium tubonense]|uniref:hypothetical protein n=1 Tax=Rhizobium tubonense TaxID=484088 RepID=UPI0030846108